MSSPDPLSIFLAVMTLISTLTGVVGTYVTFSQFRREAARRDAPQDGSAPNSQHSPASKPPFSVALRSKLGMSLGFIVLAMILGVVWKGTVSSPSTSSSSGTVVTSAENSEEGTVNVNNTGEFHNGSLHIALNSIEAKGDSDRHFATFTVSDADGKSQRITGEEVGFTMNFQDFNIRLISVSTGEARFTVKKKNGT
jgi:hypothetical protein